VTITVVRSCFSIRRLSVAMLAFGRTVLGPGRMASSTVVPAVAARAFPHLAEHDAFVVHDDADVPAGRADALADVCDELVQAARGNVASRDVASARRRRSFERKAGGAPVGLAGDVVVDVL
jgi:hypothetical protein